MLHLVLAKFHWHKSDNFSQLVYTLPFSFSKNLFPVKIGKYSRIFPLHIQLLLLLLSHILHLHSTYLPSGKTYLTFLAGLHCQCIVQNSCSFSSSITAVGIPTVQFVYKGCTSANLTLHYGTSFMHPLLTRHAQDRVITDSFLTNMLLLYPVCCAAAKHHFHFPSIHLQAINFHSSFPIYNLLICSSTSASANKIRPSAYSNYHDNATRNSFVIM